jgi:hypothetical protein
LVAADLSIEIFHGLSQRVGHLGEAQDDFNLLGRLIPPENVKSLTYSLNGGPAQSLVVPFRKDGFGDGRRLAANGDFNADIPLRSLRVGENHIKLVASGKSGSVVTTDVVLVRQEGVCLIPFNIHWNEVNDPQDVGQYIDGKWGKDRFGLRALRSGYDRIFLVGDRSWRDYEATAEITVHRIDRATGPKSGFNGLGLIMRFSGHTIGGHRNFPFSQPKSGYQPFGAIGWLRWTAGSDADPQAQYYRGDNDESKNYGAFTILLETNYKMKMRCETLADTAYGQGVSRYSWKMWLSGEDEPSSWDWQETQISTHALRTGGVAFVAHHVEASLGDISVVRLPDLKL